MNKEDVEDLKQIIKELPLLIKICAAAAVVIIAASTIWAVFI